jgi:hypothetical protein
VAGTSDERFEQRRLRSSELALAGARRRLREAEGELFDLRRRVAALETTLLEREARAAAELDELAGRLDRERRARRRAEQATFSELTRRRELEEELALLRAPVVTGAERELAAAQRRVRELEGELELVRRQSAEFEQVTRRAVEEAWLWLAEVGERIAEAEAELEELRRGRVSAAAGATEPDRGEAVAPERLDAARARLRAAERPEN